MKARMPTQLSRLAVKGDVLRLAKFLTRGSPSPDKEPFWAFYSDEYPESVSCIREGDVLEILSSEPDDLKGIRVTIYTGAYEMRSAYEKLPGYIVFEQSGFKVEFSEAFKQFQPVFKLIEVEYYQFHYSIDDLDRLILKKASE